jgi:hypothetical protein
VSESSFVFGEPGVEIMAGLSDICFMAVWVGQFVNARFCIFVVIGIVVVHKLVLCCQFERLSLNQFL